MSQTVRQVPVIGGIVMGIGAATGCDYIAGTHKSPSERAWDGAGAVLAALPYASALRPFGRAERAVSQCAGFGQCFTADATVLMADGSHQPIPQVQAHDKVQTENPETGQREVKEVLSTSVRTTHDVVTVTTADAQTHQIVDTLTCTPEHPWHTAGGWVLAGNLGVGTSILTRAGPAVVVQSVAKTHSDAGILVYNLIVQDDHTYFVGNQEEWVHNGLFCRAKFRSGVRLKVWKNAKDPITGEVRDPVTDEVMNPNERWDMGHKPGYEFQKHVESAERRGLTRKEFLDEYNDPDHYRPELPLSNQGHGGEGPPGLNFWP